MSSDTLDVYTNQEVVSLLHNNFPVFQMGYIPENYDVAFAHYDFNDSRIDEYVSIFIEHYNRLYEQSELHFQATIYWSRYAIAIYFKTLKDKPTNQIEWKKETENTEIYADFFSVSQIFANILHNSIKFTHIGEIEIVFEKNDNNNLIVKFIDSGIGISEEFLPKIFDAFSQEESGHTRRYEGNGLGLALTKGYCNLNNINISVESKKGLGSVFTLVFSPITHE